VEDLTVAAVIKLYQSIDTIIYGELKLFKILRLIVGDGPDMLLGDSEAVQIAKHHPRAT